MTDTVRSLDVEGARLHYEVRGEGPVLALIGNPMGAEGFGPLVPLLTDDYTVVTYDPRGIARSTRDDDREPTPELLADDVARVIAAVTSEPVALFGSSGGAVTGLALVTRHPGVVHTLVAHEPPLMEYLDDDGAGLAAMDDVFATNLAHGPALAMAKFFGLAGLQAGPGKMGPPPTAETLARDDYFLRHMANPTIRSKPDIAALRASATRIVIAAGAKSEGQLAYRTAFAFAERLGSEVAVFPGDHVGFLLAVEKFAETLRKVLSEQVR
jgi:pimeloyl-ACP methyl ester carboxylesterase